MERQMLPSFQPPGQRPDPATAPHSVHLLSDMSEIGHHPLPVRAGQHPFGYAGAAIDIP